MHLEITKENLQYVMNVLRIFKAKCKTKSTALYIIFQQDCSKLIYSSEGFFLKFTCDYISEFTGEYSVDIEFVKNLLNLFTDGIIEIDFRDQLIVARQGDVTFKGTVLGRPKYDYFNIKEEELEELPLELSLSNKLLSLNLEEMGFESRDPYMHLYNINKNHLIKMSSFCALFQTLEEEAPCEATLTQDILSICSVVSDTAKYYKYNNNFYICDDKLEIKAPLANLKFPSLDIIINKIKQDSETFIVKSADLLDMCEKCYVLNLPNKINRLDIVFKNGLIMYSYNKVLSGSVESGLDIDYKMSFNPLLMRGILKYINEECIKIRKNKLTNSILIYNLDETIMFMLALCR